MRPATQKLIDHVSEKIIYRDVTEKELPGDQVAVTFVLKDRQTGKTTRRILKALQELSEGRDVVFVTINHGMAQEVRHRTLRACEALYLQVVSENDRIRLKDNGKVLRFMSVSRYEEQSWWRGLPDDMVTILDGVVPDIHPFPPKGRIL